MYKERLIESFTWLFMQVEIDLLENICEDKIKDMLELPLYYSVTNYLREINHEEMQNFPYKTDYFEVMDYLLNISQQDKVKINKEIMKEYDTYQILSLISQTTRLLEDIQIMK